jgi:DNA-binding PadR family transcriptional regulator
MKHPHFSLDWIYRITIYLYCAMTVPTPNQTDFQILLALASQERHGYGIMQEIARQSGQRIRVGPGTLYGAIKRMQAAGWISESTAPRPDEEDARRTCYYRLTPTGRTAAAEAARQLADLVSVAESHGLLKLKPSH